jgi:chromosome segregation ATPase
VESSKVRSDQYSTLIDLVDIEDANVFNRVVDSASLERILFIPSETEAQALLSDARTVPRNMLHANVPNYQYYPAPNYRSYYRQDQTRGLLKASMEELVGQRMEQLRVEEEAVKAGEAKIKEAVEEKRKFERLNKEEEDKVRRIQVEIRGLNGQIANYKNEEENEAPVDIAALEDDLQVKREAIETAEEQIEGERAKSNEVVENAKEARRMFGEANDEYERKMEAAGPKEDELAGFEDSIKANRKKVVYYEAKMDDYKKKFAEGEAVATEKRQAVEAAVNRAKEWSDEKFETRKKVDSLKKEIVKLEESLKRQEETQESREVVTAEYTRLKVVFDKSDGQVRTMTKTVEYLKNMLDSRKSGFKKILHLTSKNITKNFTQQLTARHYLGKLDFNHKEKTMLILVNPDSKASAAALDVFRDIRTLSGGEKSYSSVSLILALWNAMNPPFRVLDEFDVFMDAVNRRWVLY